MASEVVGVAALHSDSVSVSCSNIRPLAMLLVGQDYLSAKWTVGVGIGSYVLASRGREAVCELYVWRG